MVRPIAEHRLPGSVRVGAVVCVLVALVIGGLHAYRVTRPRGVGVGDPEDAVAGVLTAIQREDDRGLCQRLVPGCTVPAATERVLRRRIEGAGGTGDLTVEDLEDQQEGAVHLLSVSTQGGEVIAEFQTLPGERGSTVAALTTVPGRW